MAVDQAPNAVAIRVRSILEGAPILYVFHDADDQGWQFRDGEPPDTNEGRLICIANGISTGSLFSGFGGR